MKKGTELGETSRFLQDARKAGISVRATMILGHPGEGAADVRASVDFLAKHETLLDRVVLNRFVLTTGTTLHRRASVAPESYPGFTIEGEDPQMALQEHVYAPAQSRDYRNAAGRLIDAVQRINRRRLPELAREFDGVM